MGPSVVMMSLVPLFLLGVVCYAAASTIYRGLTLPPALRGRHSAGVCGACGYAVARGHTHLCPECGRRHAEAGILTPTLARQMRPAASSVVAGWILLALVAWIVVASVASGVVDATGPADDTLKLIVTLALAGVFLLLLAGAIAWSIRRRRRIFAPPSRPEEEADAGRREHSTAQT